MGSKIKHGKEEIDPELRKVVTYPTEFQAEEYEANFWVEAPYRIVEGADGQKFIEPEFIDKKKDQKDRSIISRTYNPFNEQDLVWGAAKVDIEDEKSILNFCNQYGLFRPSGVLTFTTKSPAERRNSLDLFVEKIKDIKRTLDRADVLRREDVREFDKAKEHALKVMQDIHAKELKEINDFIDTVKKDKEDEVLNKALKQRERINQVFDEWLRKERAKESVRFVKEPLISKINSEIKSVYPVMRLGIHGEFSPGYTSDSLLAVIYFQIFELVKKQQSFNKCVYCGSWFRPLRKINSKFCPKDNPEDKRSKCQNSYDQMKFQARKAILSGEKSIEDVCGERGRSFEEVSSWVEDIVKH